MNIVSMMPLSELAKDPWPFLIPDILDWNENTRVLIDADPLNGRIIIEKIKNQCDRCGERGVEMYSLNDSVLCLECINKNIDKIISDTRLERKRTLL